MQVFPGTSLIPDDEPWRIPPEPVDPPCIPTEIVQLLVVGERQSGKTSLIRRFVHRQCATTTKDTIRKHGKSSEWSVEYHKKDIAFWHARQDAVGCARIQLWDTTGGGPSNRPLDRRQEWIRLMEKSSAILLVVSLDNGPTVLLETVRSWKRWLDDTHSSDSPIVLLIQKGDLLPSQSIHPAAWIRLGSRITMACNEVGIQRWHLTTCLDQFPDVMDSSVEDIFMNMIRSIVKTTVHQRDSQVPVLGVHPNKSDKDNTMSREMTHTIVEAEVISMF